MGYKFKGKGMSGGGRNRREWKRSLALRNEWTVGVAKKWRKKESPNTNNKINKAKTMQNVRFGCQELCLLSGALIFKKPHINTHTHKHLFYTLRTRNSGDIVRSALTIPCVCLLFSTTLTSGPNNFAHRKTIMSRWVKSLASSMCTVCELKVYVWEEESECTWECVRRRREGKE